MPIHRSSTAILTVALLSGCATGVTMTDEEAVVCKAQGCSVWTENELRALVYQSMVEGYQQGVRDARRGGKQL